MKTILLSLFTLLPAFAITCPSGSTHIVDTLLTGDGSTPAYGKILAKGPASPAGSVLSTSLTITIGTAGAVDFCLVGGSATKYSATYLLTNSAGRPTTSWEETWIVPSTISTLTISRLWGGSAAPQYLVSPSQLNAAGMADGTYCLSVLNGGVIGLVTCSGGSSGALSWASLTDSQWAGLTDSQWAAITN